MNARCARGRVGHFSFGRCHQHSPPCCRDIDADGDANRPLCSDDPTELPKQRCASEIDEPIDDRRNAWRMGFTPDGQYLPETVDDQNCDKQNQ